MVNAQTPVDRRKNFWANTISGAVRAAFGVVWAVDAWLKWQPAFLQNYLSYITGVIQGQPKWLVPWFNFWVNIITPNQALFAYLTRIIETIIALGLLFGLGRKWIYVLGAVFATLIWSIPEGFGGPYAPGATDVGGGLIYVLLFLGLIILDYSLGRSPYSVDNYIEKKVPGWRYLGEWASKDTLLVEPVRLSWPVQIVIILVILLVLIGFLLVLSSELVTNANLPASFIPLLPANLAALGRLLS